MNDIDFNSVYSARQLAEIDKEMDLIAEMQEADEIRKEKRQNAPIMEQLQQLVEQTQRQNMLLQEENERQKQQLLLAEKNEKNAKKESRHSKIFAFITFCVTTAMSIASLIVAIAK